MFYFLFSFATFSIPDIKREKRKKKGGEKKRKKEKREKKKKKYSDKFLF